MLIFENVNKSYVGPSGTVDVLKGFSCRFAPGDLAVLQGPSGCGKSTLLFIAGAMLRPNQGDVSLHGESLYRARASRRHALRGTSIGFIFQRFHLIPYLTVAENILWPLRWSAEPEAAASRLDALTHQLQIAHRLLHRPAQLSAGEQQRVAVARALIGRKQLICADEPTGNLDEDNAAIILDILKAEAQRGAIVLLITHQKAFADWGNRHLQWHDLQGKNPCNLRDEPVSGQTP